MMDGLKLLAEIDKAQRKEEAARFCREFANTFGTGNENYCSLLKSARKFDQQADYHRKNAMNEDIISKYFP
jgi:uncharacterized tellurite resistance protein B-like protein